MRSIFVLSPHISLAKPPICGVDKEASVSIRGWGKTSKFLPISNKNIFYLVSVPRNNGVTKCL